MRIMTYRNVTRHPSPKRPYSNTLGRFSRLFLLLFVVTAFTTCNDAPPSSPHYKMKDSFIVGYWNFAVWSTKWEDSIGTDDKQWPDARFLVVELYAENKDKTASVIPPIKLVDTQGREYDQSTKEVYVKDYFSPFKSLNPDVGAFGYLVFDVPADRKYALKLSGGMNTGAVALVDLAP